MSRNTFFNYFGSKSELLWVELDASRHALTTALAEVPRGTDPLAGVEQAVFATADGFGAARAPLVLTQWEVMGVDAELRATGLARALAHADAIETHLAGRLTGPDAAFRSRAVALAVLGAAAAAVGQWAAAGPGRDPLRAYLERVVHPVVTAFAGRPVLSLSLSGRIVSTMASNRQSPVSLRRNGVPRGVLSRTGRVGPVTA